MTGRRLRPWILVADIAAILIALVGAALLRYGSTFRHGLTRPEPWAPLLVAALAVASWTVLYEPMSLDCFRDGWRFATAISRIELACVMQMGVILAVAYLLRIYFSRLLMVYFGGLFCLLALGTRLLALRILRWRRQSGQKRRVVILGDGRVARELARRIEGHPEWLYEVAGFLNFSTACGNGSEQAATQARGSQSFSTLEALEFLERSAIRELIVCLNHAPALEVQNFLAACRERNLRINLLPQTYELYSCQATLREIHGVPLVSIEAANHLGKVLAWKRTMDLILTPILLLVALPILLFLGAAFWLQGRRFLRRELRCGQHGKQFWMYRLDIDRDGGASRWEQLLCRLSLTELPQLFNVLEGAMSLVGPRPEPPERVRQYSEWQQQRLKMKPGMTGLAQVRGLREEHSSEEKARHDLQYMVRWSPIIDLALLLETWWTLAGRLWGPHESCRVPKPQKETQQTSPPTSRGFTESTEKARFAAASQRK